MQRTLINLGNTDPLSESSIFWKNQPDQILHMPFTNVLDSQPRQRNPMLKQSEELEDTYLVPEIWDLLIALRRIHSIVGLMTKLE